MDNGTWQILRYNKIEREGEKKIKDAIYHHDENTLTEEILILMEAYMQDKVKLVALDTIAEQYISIPIYWDEKEDFKFKDKKLEFVFRKLSSIEQYTDSDAKKIVTELINKLKN
jgi:hypothetical protein